ncbi:MAG: hypothetical protein PHV39_06495 [Methanomicrobium sp.]|nr:hypothetical protein [Methanomicrobium sp.]
MKKNNKIKAFVFTVIVAVIFLSVQTAAAADTIAKGDPVYIEGTVTGNPQQGLAVWVFGPNYWTRETQAVSGSTYTYEITGSTTENMAAGQYFCIVQHPMYNGVFDADLTTAAGSGQIKVTSTAGQSFIIDGSGKLQGSSAAYALMNMLDSPDIDDTYIVTEFYIAEPWIRFTPKETYYAGDTLLISGQTNIAAGERLIYEVYSASFEPTSKSSSSEFSGQSGYTTVIPSLDENTWEVYLDTADLKPDLYNFKISREDGTAAYSAEFTLAEGTGGKTETAQVTVAPAKEPAAEETTQKQQTSAQTAAPAAGAGFIPVVLSLAFAFIAAALKKY